MKSFQGDEERSLMNDDKIRIDFQARCRWFSLSLAASQFYFYDFIWRNQIDKGNNCNRRLLFLSSQNCFYFNSVTNRTSSHLSSCYALWNISAYQIWRIINIRFADLYCKRRVYFYLEILLLWTASVLRKRQIFLLRFHSQFFWEQSMHIFALF